MRQVQQGSMVFILVASAILLAIATFIAMLLLVNRPEAPADVLAGTLAPAVPRQVLVDGILVTLNPDPNKEALTLAEAGPDQPVVPTVPDPAVPAEQPPPAAAQVQPTPVPPTPTPTPPPPTPIPEPVIFIDYVVQQGDSLYSIADNNNSAIELMALHGIDDEDLIPGTTLRLPVANPAFCPGNRAYVVRDKDTVFRIAQQFNTTAAIIASMNAAIDDSYRVNVTQVICVPG